MSSLSVLPFKLNSFKEIECDTESIKMGFDLLPPVTLQNWSSSGIQPSFHAPKFHPWQKVELNYSSGLSRPCSKVGSGKVLEVKDSISRCVTDAHLSTHTLTCS